MKNFFGIIYLLYLKYIKFMTKLFLFLGITFIANSILAPSVLAGTTNISPGDIQIEVGGIRLDFEGGISILDQLSLSDSGNSMDITVSGSAYAKFISNNRRAFDVTSSSFVAKGCNLTNSFVSIETPDGTPATTINITPLATTCSGDSGAGGGGGTGNSGSGLMISAVVVPAITPVTVEEIIDELLEKIEEIQTKEEELLPKPIIEEIINLLPKIVGLTILNLELPPFPEEPEPLPPPAPLNIETIAEATQEVASTVTAVAVVATESIVKIFNGLTTGSEGSVVIAKVVEDTGSLEWDTSAPKIAPEETDTAITPTKKAEPARELEERKDYKITIISAADPNIKAESESFEMRAKKGAPIIKAMTIENMELSNLFYIIKNLFLGRTNEVKAAETLSAKPTLKIIRPKAGDVWIIGENNKIEWESKNLPAGGVQVSVKKGFDLKIIITSAFTQMSAKLSALANNSAIRTSVKYILFPLIIGIFVIIYLATRPLKKG